MRGVCEVHLTAVWGLGVNKHPLMHRKQDHHTFTPHRGRRTGSLRAGGEYTLGTSQRTHWNLIPKPNVSAWDYSGLGCPSLMQIIKSWLLTEGHVDHWDKPRGLPSLQSFCCLLFFWLLGCLQSFCPLFHLMLAEGQGRLESFIAFSQMRNIKLWDTDLNEVTPNEVIPALLFPMQGSLYGSSRSCVYRGTNRWHCPSCTSTHPQRPVCPALFQLLQTEWRTTQTLWHKGSDDATLDYEYLFFFFFQLSAPRRDEQLGHGLWTRTTKSVSAYLWAPQFPVTENWLGAHQGTRFVSYVMYMSNGSTWIWLNVGYWPSSLFKWALLNMCNTPLFQFLKWILTS